MIQFKELVDLINSAMYSVIHSQENTKRFTEWVGKKRVREEIEGTSWRKRRATQ